MRWLSRVGDVIRRPFQALLSAFRALGQWMRQRSEKLASVYKSALAGLALLAVAAGAVWAIWLGIGGLPGGLNAQSDADAEAPLAIGMLVATDLNVNDVATGNASGSPSGDTSASSLSAAGSNYRERLDDGQVPSPSTPNVTDEARPGLDIDQMALPVSGTVRQPAGWRRHVEHGYWYYEPGVEIAADDPTVYSVLPGYVARVTAASSPYSGHAVVIEHGDGLATEYKPLQQVYVVPGQYVSARAPIGLADDAVVFALFQEGEALDTMAVWAEQPQ